jgi:glycosyltransferase involved in cell wall biosynthesis
MSVDMIQRVIFPFRGAELGGSHVATFTLARALRDRFGVECVVLCPIGTAIMDEARRHGIRALFSGEAPTGANDLIGDYAGLARRQRLLENERLDGGCVVHCNDINSLRAWGLPARLNGMGVVYHHHALNKLWWPPHLISLAWATAVLCISDITYAGVSLFRPDAIKEFNPFELDPAYDRAPARAALVREFGWPEDARIVGAIGNLWKRKRPDFFLRTAAELVRRDPKFRFVLFGRGGDYSVDEIRQLAASLGLSAVTAIPGFRPDVAANLACLDLLMAPALNEPFGRTLVEAIILGTPVVATRGAGHSEIIGAWGGGQLSNESDTAAESASLILDVLDHPDRGRLPPQRRRQLADQLAPAAHAERVLSVYRRACRSRHAAEPTRAVTHS